MIFLSNFHEAGKFLFIEKLLGQDSKELRNQFNKAKPFKHLVLDQAFPEAYVNALIDCFTDYSEREAFSTNSKGVQELKRQFHPGSLANPERRIILDVFNSTNFLNFLEAVTGIKGLIPDPHFVGGGFHETLEGGFLGRHVDFRVHEHLRLVRRLNVILYLNCDWIKDDGGLIEFFDKEGKEKLKEYLPIKNRLIIFETTSTSYHGHTQKVKNGRVRRSVALYFYTADGSAYDVETRRTTIYVKASESSAEKFSDYLLSLKNLSRDIIPPVLWRLFYKIWVLISRRD